MLLAALVAVAAVTNYTLVGLPSLVDLTRAAGDAPPVAALRPLSKKSFIYVVAASLFYKPGRAVPSEDDHVVNGYWGVAGCSATKS